MRAAQRVRNSMRGFLQAYATENMKRRLWNNEFSGGRWTGPDRAASDCAYPYVEKYARNGCILDLGCGAGHTANGLNETTYQHYMGVDISDVAIASARRTTGKNGRTAKHGYAQSDIFSYVPTQQYDVILFIESIYYVPWGRIVPMLTRYAKYLTTDGVFIARLWSGGDRYTPIVKMITGNFHIIEQYRSEEPQAVVLVFREPGPLP